METENKNQIDKMEFGFYKKSITTTVLISMVFSVVMPALLFPLDPVLADNKMSPTPATQPGSAAAGAVPQPKLNSETINEANRAESVKVYDSSLISKVRETNTITSSFKKGVEVIADTFNTRDWSWENLKDAVYVASKEALNYLLNTFAYDVATWLASGDKGQQPMFFTDGWGSYLTNVLDEAGGVFLESLGEDWGNFNLCNPTVFNLKVSIGLGIAEMDKPKKPSCTITQMVNNWDKMISDGKILDNIDLMFDSKNNDFGITLDILGRHAEYKTQSALSATKDREEGQGAKSVTSKIAGIITTPSFLVKDIGFQMVAEGNTASKQVDYGDIFMGAIVNFANTLAGKLLDRIFKEGLAALSGSDNSNKDSDNSDLFDALRTGEEIGRNLYNLLTNQDDELYTGQTGTTLFAGKQASQERYSGLLRAGVKETGPYDVLTKFVVCQDPKNPGVDECVIDQKFRSAISKKITLRQAISEGLINGDAPFGYKAATIKEGIPYRTIVILRAHRIVPIGWELAARVANEFVPQETWTLNKLIENYNVLGSPFKGLVDPNWVLEVPLHYCKAQGYGAKILSDKIVAGTDANNDGDYDDASDLAPGRTVSREQYCADFQTCIQKSSDGGCLYYGYCTEEKPIWDLDGKECKSQFNTCLTFQKAGDKVVSYLENTLNYNNCSKENAGCQWYCNEFNTINNIWSCTAESEKVLKTCSQTSRDSQGVVGCITNASCEMNTGDTVCNDLVSGIKMVISQPCSNTTKWWNAATNKCTVSASCTIPKGGVYCQVGGCENQENLLPNPSFETASTTYDVPSPALGWYADTNYFKKVGSALDYIYRGKSSLRFYNAGTLVSENAISGNVLLKTGSYTFSGYIFNNLNVGEIKIAAINAAGSEIKSIALSTEGKQTWYQASFDFSVTADTQVRVKINVTDPNGNQVSGSAWFDNFRISQSCITNPITLTMVGDVEKSESKINFDRDVKTCPSDAAGCTEFISLQPNGSVNLVRNASFEDWLDGTPLPRGWRYGEHWSGSNNEISRYTPGVLGSNALLIKNGSDNHYRDFSTDPIVGMKPNTSYRVSFYIKTDDSVPGQNWYAEIISDNNPDYYCAQKTSQNCASVACDAGDTCISDWTPIDVGGKQKFTLTNNWRRIVFDVITTRSLGYDFKLSFDNALDENSTIIIDGVQIEEVDTRNPIASEFRNYGTSNLFNIKKAPDNLSCRGYTKTRPSPYVLPGVGYEQCVGDTLVWRKFCDGGENAGQPCGGTADCPGAECRPDSCSSVNPNECCHEIDAPICSNYSMLCQEDEVGCQLFTPVGQSGAGTKLSAVAQLTDYCPAECVGYEAFYQSATFLERQQTLEYFIPKTAKSCPASAVGCDEFTNLDEVAKGGEGKEYYQYLRLCQKPTEPAANCTSFYAWQGSDEAGYQLKSYLLKADTNNTPARAITDLSLLPDAWCSDKTLDATGLPECCNGPEDIITNPFCKELIGADSQISYRIYLNTISCSNDCHPYRKTVYGGSTADNQTNCTQTSGNWDSNLNACIYQAIPNEGLKCSSANAGCREYRGNTAGNVYIALSDTFETGTTVNWSNGVISSEALSVGGHSIRSYSNNLETIINDLGSVCNKDSATYDSQSNRCTTTTGDCSVAIGQRYCGVIGSSLTAGKMYIIGFWAKTSSDIRNLDLKLKTAGISDNTLGSVSINNDWAYYLIGPVTYDQTKDINLSSRLNFSSDGDFYLDNLIVKEVNNFVYAIKGSWNTPASCDTNPFLAEPISAPQFMLGCKQYLDSDNLYHNLKSFSNLCREEAVGCQAMIDTYNSTSPFEVKAPFEDKLSTVTVPEDKLTYIVNRADVRCNAQYQGCQAFGVPTISYDSLSKPVVTGYSQAYLINDPDAYNSILCARGENGCDEYQSANGYSYFKDPGTQTCEWKLIPNKNKYGWFRTDMSSDTPNCPMVNPPVGQAHPDGSKGFVGLCPADQNTCTLFIDPISDISKNQIFNSDFYADVDNDKTPDGWIKSGSTVYQKVSLSHDTLYTFSVEVADKTSVGGLSVVLTNCLGLRSFDNSMVISGSTAQIPMDYIVGDTREINNLNNNRAYSARIYSPADMTCRLEISGLDGTNPKSDLNSKLSKVALRETGQYYTLANTVDTLTCNGVVNPNNGCVLFNDRSYVNYHLGENDISYLSFDADASGVDDRGQPINNGLAVSNLGRMPGDSNSVLKVIPDRTCATWLACTGSVSETDDKNADKKYCTDLGLCDQADENGNCTNFVVTKEGNDRQTYFDRELIKNYSGFAQSGLAFESVAASLPGNFLPAEMQQVGGIAFSPSTNFETITAGDFRPYGWNLDCPQTTNPPVKNFLKTEWKREYAQVITNPVSAQQEGLSSAAPEGTAFVKLTGPYVISSEKIDVNGNTKYTVSAYINTEKLITGQARIVIEEYDLSSSVPIKTIGLSGPQLEQLRLNSSQKWTFKIAEFITETGASSIKIKLMNFNEKSDRFRNPCTNTEGRIHEILGSSYFDDIKVKPSLEVSRDSNGSIFVPPTCRVYPESDSLSCDYYSDKGYHFRGWLGYCLEPDPANSAQCLMWWPVELIQGGFISEEPSVAQRPLYYCLGAKESHYRYRQCVFEDGEMCASLKRPSSDKSARTRNIEWTVPGSWRVQSWQVEGLSVASSISDCGASDQCGINFGLFKLIKNPTIPNSYFGSGISADLIYDNDGLLEKIKFEIVGPNCLCADMDVVLQVVSSWCQYVAQTITPYGQNKAWWERVSNNSGQLFAVPGVGYTNLFDYPPFGALVPPYPVDNPAVWDLRSSGDTYFAPLRVEEPQTGNFADPYQARAGLPYACSQLSAAFGDTSCTLPTLNRATSSSIVYNKDVAQAQDSLKRIFAKSYETYQFQGDGVCKTSSDQVGGKECACPESTCGLEANVTFNTCKNTGAVCEVGQFACMDISDIGQTLIMFIVESGYTSGPNIVAMIVGAVVQVVLEFLTACSPKPCDSTCDAGEGQCIPLPQYLTNFYGLSSDDPGAFSIVWNLIFGNLFSSIFALGEDPSSDSIADIIQDAVDSGGSNEYLLEGQGALGSLGAVGLVLGNQLEAFTGNYCSLTDFRCQSGTNDGSRCCFFSSCQAKQNVTYRCLAGPNKGMICDPDEDNCGTSADCKIRTANESYLPINDNQPGVLQAALPWNPPTGLCTNNSRPEFVCKSGLNRNNSCLSNNDCPSFVGVCIKNAQKVMVCRDKNGDERPSSDCNTEDDKNKECRTDDASCVLKSDMTTLASSLSGMDYCAVAPAVTSVKVNNAANAELSLYGGDTASLTFTVKINPQQLPLTSYTIDWGDAKKTSLSGQSLLSRENSTKPFSASHTYSYWELRALDSKSSDGTNSDVKCRNRSADGKCCHANEDFCRVLPRVQIIDNWNWCNNGNGQSGYYGSGCAAEAQDNKTNPAAAANAWMPYAKELRIYP